ncbi:MAG: hypothetical protein HQM09_22430 [Candidatus Riflebacteria bacterium]|nr:hypothetical protein [Candidatus Riflebacteria bacterium]
MTDNKANVTEVVFIATLGQSDIQLVLEKEGRRESHKIDGDIRAFHEACLDGRIRWQCLPLTDSLSLTESRENASYDEKTTSFTIPGLTAPMDVSACVTLCAPVLAKSQAMAVKAKNQRRVGQFVEALLIFTHRDKAGKQTDGEPIAAYELIKEALATALDIAIDAVHPCNCIDKGDLYCSDGTGQKKLRLEIADRIYCDVGAIAGSPRGRRIATVSTSGGMPSISQVTASVVSYWFPQDRIFHATAAQFEHGQSDSRHPAIAPDELIDMRRRVKELIIEGSFEPAERFAAYTEMHLKKNNRPFSSFIKNVVEFHEHGATEIASDLPGNTARQLKHIDGLGPSLRIGFRIESALRSGRWLNALQTTFTFIDVFTWELIDRSFSLPGKDCIDLKKGVINCRNIDVSELDGKLPQEILSRLKSVQTIYVGDQFDVGGKKRGIQRILENCLSGTTMKCIREIQERAGKIRIMRNNATHGFLDLKGLRDARKNLIAEKLWFEKQEEAGFLDADFVRSNFALIGSFDPLAEYDDFIRVLCLDIDEFPLGSDVSNA